MRVERGPTAREWRAWESVRIHSEEENQLRALNSWERDLRVAGRLILVATGGEDGSRKTN